MEFAALVPFDQSTLRLCHYSKQTIEIQKLWIYSITRDCLYLSIQRIFNTGRCIVTFTTSDRAGTTSSQTNPVAAVHTENLAHNHAFIFFRLKNKKTLGRLR